MTFGQIETASSTCTLPLIDLVPDSFLKGQEVISSIARKHLHCHWLQQKKVLISRGERRPKKINLNKKCIYIPL